MIKNEASRLKIFAKKEKKRKKKKKKNGYRPILRTWSFLKFSLLSPNSSEFLFFFISKYKEENKEKKKKEKKKKKEERKKFWSENSLLKVNFHFVRAPREGITRSTARPCADAHTAPQKKKNWR